MTGSASSLEQSARSLGLLLEYCQIMLPSMCSAWQPWLGGGAHQQAGNGCAQKSWQSKAVFLADRHGGMSASACPSRKSRFHGCNKFCDFCSNPRFSRKSAISLVFVVFCTIIISHVYALFTQCFPCSCSLVGYLHRTTRTTPK